MIQDTAVWDKYLKVRALAERGEPNERDVAMRFRVKLEKQHPWLLSECEAQERARHAEAQANARTFTSGLPPSRPIPGAFAWTQSKPNRPSSTQSPPPSSSFNIPTDRDSLRRYAREMASWLNIGRDAVTVVEQGIDLASSVMSVVSMFSAVAPQNRTVQPSQDTTMPVNTPVESDEASFERGHDIAQQIQISTTESTGGLTVKISLNARTLKRIAKATEEGDIVAALYAVQCVETDVGTVIRQMLGLPQPEEEEEDPEELE